MYVIIFADKCMHAEEEEIVYDMHHKESYLCRLSLLIMTINIYTCVSSLSDQPHI